ncbi:MAG TPA: hypothetical protein VMH22_03560 [bacterium]|nr:hypothetical protein [bacterium]
MNRSLLWLTAAILVPVAVFGSAWVGQDRVNRPDGDTCELAPFIACDGSGRPWVCWMRKPSDSCVRWTRWTDGKWDQEQGVVPNPPNLAYSYPHSICFDREGVPWIGLGNWYENNTSDMFSSRWNGSTWGSEIQINPPDSTLLEFAPVISCGGDQMWSVWYGGPSSTAPYSVYASRWNAVKGVWDSVMQVSPPNGNNHWWCDMAVDSMGRPHVVWTETEHLAVYYSFYDGTQWSEPLLLNDSSREKAAAWTDPHIAIDRDGILHVDYTGVLNGAPARDVFYTRNDGSGWTPSVRVTQDTVVNYDEWYSDIAASSSDNVWIVFMRQGEGSDEFRLYAVHFDGQSWSEEQRLDNGSSLEDCDPAVCLDASGCPWVIWDGVTPGASTDIFYNRIAAPSAIHETTSGAAVRFPSVVCGVLRVPASSVMRGASCALLDISGREVLQLHAGANDVRALAPGVYFVRGGLGTGGEGLGKTRKVVVTR